MKTMIRIVAWFTLLAAGLYPAMAADVVKGGTLTMIVQPEPSVLVSAFNTAAPIGVVSTKILEGLLTYDFDMTPKPVLAETWKVSPDGKTILFNLRKGVKWHDGKEFTSADVQFSVMKVWKELHPHGRSTFAKVTAVETPSPYVAILKLSEPSPYLMSALSGYESQILPRHLYEGTDLAANPYNSKPVGTGPFVFKEWQKGNFVLLERNPAYWDNGRPYLDKLVIRIIPDASARAAAFETGEVQLGGFSPVPLNDVKRLDATGKFDVETRGYEYLAPMFLMEFNLSNQYLKDIRVRRAIAHAVDRDLIVKTIWFGFGKPATGPVPSVLTQFYSPDVTKYPFDPKKAEELLDEAGFKRGAGGKRFKLIHDFLPYGNDYQRTAEYLKQALGKVGIEVEIRSQDVAAFIKRIYTDNDFDFCTNFFYAMPDPTIGVQRIYWSKNIKKGVPFSNSSGYSNPETDKLIEAIQVEHDRRKRKDMIGRFQQIVVDELPVLDLFEVKFFTLASKRVQNHTDTAEGVYSSFSRVWLKKQ